MISETRERFLRAIVGTVPAERIAEIHFFPPIKQGGVESGVAVIAAGDPAPPLPAPSVAAGDALAADPANEFATEPADATDATEADAEAERPIVVAYPVEGPADVASPEATEDADGTERDEPPFGAGVAAHGHPRHDGLGDAMARAGADVDADEPSDDDAAYPERVVRIAARPAPSMTDDIPTTPVLDDLASGEDAATDAGDVPDEEPPARRFTVFTAHYRLVLKGLDRGKWEAGVVADADAPLLTVEAVVRGVQRRAGDVDDPERMTGDEVRAELARMDAAAAALRTPGALRAS